jgi:hypothetical protein
MFTHKHNKQVVLPAYRMAIFDIADLPSQLQPMLQQNYLQTSFEDYLTAHNGYWEGVDNESFTETIFDKNRGVTITRTRPGLKAPVVVAANPTAAQTPPNDGVTPSDFDIEQYTFAPFELTDGIDLDLIGTNFAIVDRFTHDVKTSYHQATQSMDLLARDTYIAGYAAAYTLINQAPTGDVVHVDDIRGFSTVITVGAGSTNGVLTPVSSTYTLPVFIYVQGSPTVVKTAVVNTAVPDTVNISDYVLYGTPYGTQGAPTAARGNGVSGLLTLASISGGYTLQNGDVLVAGDAPIQLFAGGAVHFSQVTSGITQALLLDACGYLENNAVMPSKNMDGFDEGTYICHIAPSISRQLFNDPDFKQANQTLGQSEVYQQGKVSQYVGVTFLKNTNAPRIPLAAYGGTGYAYLTLVTGQGALIDAWYEGLVDWVESGFNPGLVELNRGVAQILMPAYLDRQGRQMHIDWLTIRDMVCPTDVTRSSVVLTGTGGRRARAVAIWSWSAS